MATRHASSTLAPPAGLAGASGGAVWIFDAGIGGGPMRSKRQQPPSGGSSKAKGVPGLGKSTWEWLKSLAAGFLLFLVVRLFVIQTFVITSGSMEGTLLVGDLLVLNKVAYGATLPGTAKRLPGYRMPDVGDVVVFAAHHERLDVIKRIVGRAGDT